MASYRMSGFGVDAFSSFCVLAGNSLWAILGLGTVVNAFCSGPLIQFFRGRIEGVFFQKGKNS